MTPELLAQFVQVGGALGGLGLLIRFMDNVIQYQRKEKEECQAENRRLVDLLVKHSDLDASAILNHNEDT